MRIHDDDSIDVHEQTWTHRPCSRQGVWKLVCTALDSCVFGDARAGMADERLEVRRQLLEVPRARGAAARRQLGCAACLLPWNTSAEHMDAQTRTTADPMQRSQMQDASNHGKTNRHEE